MKKCERFTSTVPPLSLMWRFSYNWEVEHKKLKVKYWKAATWWCNDLRAFCWMESCETEIWTIQAINWRFVGTEFGDTLQPVFCLAAERLCSHLCWSYMCHLEFTALLICSRTWLMCNCSLLRFICLRFDRTELMTFLHHILENKTKSNNSRLP